MTDIIDAGQSKILRLVTHGDKDDLPSVDGTQLVVLYRNVKPTQPWCAEDTPVAVVSKGISDKAWQMRGMAASATLLTIHDGTADYFDSMPSHVKKRFPGTTALIASQSLHDKSGKVFAIVLENYQSKGVARFEITNTKLRQGFGKGSVHRLVTHTHTKADGTAFFSKAGKPKTVDAVDAEDVGTASDTHEPGHDNAAADPPGEPADTKKTEAVGDAVEPEADDDDNDDHKDETNETSDDMAAPSPQPYLV